MAARLALALTVTFALSCTMPTGGMSDTQSAIDTVLQRRADAVVRNDAAAFRSTVDADRPALRRTQQDLYDMMRARGGAPTMTRAIKLEAYGSYTRAYVEDFPERMLLGMSGPPSYRRVYFRQESGKWLVSEPRTDELGDARRRLIDNIEIEHWAIDADIVEVVAHAVTVLRAEIAQTSPWLPAAALSMRLYPTSETIGLSGVPGAAATHAVDASRDRTLRVYDLWWAQASRELAPFSRFVLRDQLLGMTREQLAPRAYLRMDWWLRHGLGLAAGGADPGPAMSTVCAEPLSWKEMFDGPRRDDAMAGGGMDGEALAPTYTTFISPTTPRAFLQARSMVDHLRAAHGERAYWDLVLAYQDQAGPGAAYRKAMSLAPERFYAEWLSWARARC